MLFPTPGTYSETISVYACACCRAALPQAAWRTLFAGWISVQSFCEWWLVAEQSAAIDGFVRATFPGAALLEHTAATFRYQVSRCGPRGSPLSATALPAAHQSEDASTLAQSTSLGVRFVRRTVHVARSQIRAAH